MLGGAQHANTRRAASVKGGTQEMPHPFSLVSLSIEWRQGLTSTQCLLTALVIMEGFMSCFVIVAAQNDRFLGRFAQKWL